MGQLSGDRSILEHIEELVSEERKLHEQGGLDGDGKMRLANINVELDQCWDLLRQRRALREFGKDPDAAQIRKPEVVENYQQ
jgi:hypothetical protein